MEMIFLKILVACTLSWLLVLVAQRTSARFSGIISSLPNVSLIVMLFIGLEQGVQFSGKACVYSIYGVLLNLILALSLIWGSYQKKKFLQIVMPVVSYSLAVVIVIYFLPQEPKSAFLWTLLTWLFVVYALRKVPFHEMTKGKSHGLSAIFGKFIGVSTVILFTTSIAGAIGERWAGVLSTFPAVTLPVTFFMAYKFGVDIFRSFLKGAVFAWLPTAFYFLVTTYSFNEYGIYRGTFLALLTSILLVIGLEGLNKLFKRIRKNTMTETILP